MDEKRENGIFWIALLVLLWILLACVFFALCSCTTKKVITETVYVHDTIHSHHTDTVSVEKWNWRHDTLRIETERVVTLLQPDKSLPAETIRVETNNWHWQHEVVRDSDTRIVVKIDSVLRALDKQKEKTTVKTKPLVPWWQYAIFVTIVGGILIAVLRYKK